MLSENTPLAPLPVTNRNTTPSKIIRIGGNTTPTQNLSPLTAGSRPTSNPNSGNRPSSNSRSSAVPNVVRLVQKTLKDEEVISKLTERAPSRSSSRRKQRRWENMNLFGIHEILSSHSKSTGGKGSEEEEEEYLNQYLFPVDVHNKPSAFHELFLHKELLSIFRHCEEDLSFSSSAVRTGSHHPLRTLEDKAWLNIEKKIRTILLQTASENIKHFQFLFLIEKLLFSFVQGQLIPFNSASSSSSLSASTTSSMNLITSYQLIEDKTGKESLKIELMESSFYRLLFHGICQFYNLKSQSYIIKNSKNKYIQVTKPKKLSLVFEKGLSLTKYLYSMIITSSSSVGDDEKKEKYEECMKEKENNNRVDINELTSEFEKVDVKEPVSVVDVDVCADVPSVIEDDISLRDGAPSVNSDGSDGYIIIDESEE
jgi:hypothetical protein